MNYEEARQIGPDGPAPGKWNWTNRRDNSIYTTGSCAWPDYVWPKDVIDYTTIKPTGRERCDHDTREQAERHHYDYDVEKISWHPIDLNTTSTLHRCEIPGCAEWSTVSTSGHGWGRGTYCDLHGNSDGYRLAHPFVPGLREMHS